MKRTGWMGAFVALVMVIIAIAAAQAPKGWMVRADRSTSASDPDAAGTIKFTTASGGFHAVNPQAAVFWNPANTASGAYTVKGTFVLQKPSGHTNYYGLIFGGSDLDNAKQSYTYFLVAQDGTFLVKKRDGDANTENVAPKAPSDAIKKPDASGKSTNALEVRVGTDKIDYVVNDKVVHTMPKRGVKTDGVYGIRVNHLLDVQIEGFGKS
jgi:hypothetical protein